MLIETKLSPPKLRAELVERGKLLRQLDGILKMKLAVVSAPAGFGKSTLLAQWAQRCRETSIAVGWLSLDEGDDDFGRFIEYFVAALQKLAPNVGREVLALVRSSPILPTDSILAALVNTLAEVRQEVVLVLDDGHFLTLDEITAFLDALIAYAPPNFHLVVSTRSRVPLRIGSMRVRGQVFHLAEANLKFSLSEASEYLNSVCGLQLEDSQVMALQYRTEGWIAGLHLASLSLDGRPDTNGFIQKFSGTDKDVADFLLQDVLQRLPDTILAFLRRTSILERFNPGLAAAVSGMPDAQAALAEVDESNLFLITLDRDNSWFRYHHLFAELLQSMLHKDAPDEVAILHDRAADWLVAHGLTTDAIRHALAAQNHDKAARLVESCCMPLIQQGHITRVQEWLNSLPDSLVASRPRLLLAEVWVLFHMSKARQAASLLKVARTAIMDVDRKQLLSPAERDQLRAELYALTAGVISAADRSATAARLAKVWLRRFPEAELFCKGTLGNVLGFSLYSLGRLTDARLACLAARDSHAAVGAVFGVVYSDLILGLVDHAEGNLSGAHQCFGRAIRYAQDSLGPGSYAEAMVGVFEAELLYERNDLEGADLLLNKHRQIVEECGLVVHEMACKLGQARIAEANGKTDEALVILEAAERQGLRTKYRRLFTSALHDRVRLLLKRGDVKSARLALRVRGIDDGFVVNAKLPPADEWAAFALARVLLAEGRPEQSMKLLDRLAAAMREGGRVQRLIQVRAFSAIAAHRGGDALGALAALVDAVSLAAPQNALRALIDEGEGLFEVLEFGRRRVPSWNRSTETSDFIAKVLAARSVDQPSDPQRERSRLTPQFSTREADVARLLAVGGSNRDLAQQLAMAPDTVKWHLKNIFGKLGVSNRTQAVLKLQDLGITTTSQGMG
jgi:LuxR family maltose regulon positive regulatory protein